MSIWISYSKLFISIRLDFIVTCPHIMSSHNILTFDSLSVMLWMTLDWNGFWYFVIKHTNNYTNQSRSWWCKHFLVVPSTSFRATWIGVRYDASLSRYIWYNGIPVQYWPPFFVKASGASDMCVHFKLNGFINCAERRKYTCRRRPMTTAGKIGNYVAYPWLQGSWGQHGAHLGPTGPRWAPCGSREPCYMGYSVKWIRHYIIKTCRNLVICS